MTHKNRNVLITGIDEFIGLRTAEKAITQGMKVCGLQSCKKQKKNVQDLGIDIIIGDINDPMIAQKACQGVDVVIHTHELAKEGGEIEEFRKVNVKGTINISKAAKKSGVKTFIHISNALVYGFDYPHLATEDSNLVGENNPYCETKIEAEKALLELNSPPHFGVIIIRPGDVYGPGSIPWVVRPVMLMKQKLFAYVNDGSGIINHCYIDNLIDAIFLSIEKQPYGEVFNITDGQETSCKTYFSYLAKMTNLPIPFALPKDELKLFLKLRYQGQKLFRKPVDIFPEAVDFMSRPHAYSIDKARDILNYEPSVNLEQGLEITKQWLQKTNLKEIIL